jgi:hypothetical protein
LIFEVPAHRVAYQAIQEIAMKMERKINLQDRQNEVSLLLFELGKLKTFEEKHELIHKQFMKSEAEYLVKSKFRKMLEMKMQQLRQSRAD